ncbi:MAG TPA: glycosyltransferase [Kofleriaceae bacterium]|nr:glycosyltransferase [Kofleriaceae bacterium]
MKIVILGLSITSSWGNGHATTYRGLVRALAARGHEVTFLERDVPWYAEHRDFPDSDHVAIRLYRSLDELSRGFAAAIRAADLTIVGSYVVEGTAVCDWVLETARGIRAFYDIDTPITLSELASGKAEYLAASHIPEFDLYLSFSGGPVLRWIESHHGAKMARPLYCSVDPQSHAPSTQEPCWALGYMGTYCEDRQPALQELLLDPARGAPGQRFVVAGPQYPPDLRWPPNVDRIDHVAPSDHGAFFGAQRFTLNLTRRAMIDIGYSPSVRLFEAAACGSAIISDSWPGLEELFTPGKDILVARTAHDTARFLSDISDDDRRAIGDRARQRVLTEHTAAVRAETLEGYIREIEGAHTA